MTREALKKLNEKQMNCIACTSFDWDEEKERLKL